MNAWPAPEWRRRAASQQKPVADFVIGVDGGATRTRAVVLTLQGRELAAAEGGPGRVDAAGSEAALQIVRATATRAVAEAGARLPALALCAGLAGAGREAERSAAESRLHALGLAHRVLVITDAEAALQDAFGDGPGILVIAGTGSVAWGRAESGTVARSGGWGALLGDEGSGYDIARRALRAAARAADGRGPDTQLLPAVLERLQLAHPDDLVAWAASADKGQIAALATLVAEIAEHGDDVARDILERAVRDLVAHVEVLIRKLGPWRSPPRLAATGGLVDPGAPLPQPLFEAARRLGCAALPRPVRAAIGAAHLALRLAARAGA
ncbi:MAG: hypothetical protein HY701_07835 [Gemmatimonadetes bacterium]|nr:hypothetical protein [Gemmatimonadota bacterium]